MKKLILLIAVVFISACSPLEPEVGNIQGGAISPPAGITA